MLVLFISNYIGKIPRYHITGSNITGKSGKSKICGRFDNLGAHCVIVE